MSNAPLNEPSRHEGGYRANNPACVNAAYDALPACDECPRAPAKCIECTIVAEGIARAVLDAFVAGEGEGRWPWTVEQEGTGWFVSSPDPKKDDIFFPTEAQARAVAAVLNYMEAKGE